MSSQLPNGLWADFQPQEDARVKANANFNQLDWTQWKCINAQLANAGLLPGSPNVGDAYLVGAATVHIWYNSQWNILTPPCGWMFYDQTLNEFFWNVGGVTTNFQTFFTGIYNFIVGPGISVVNNLPVFDNVTGNLAADSGVSIDPLTQNMTGVNDMDVGNDLNVGNDTTIGGNVEIQGTGPHVVDPSFANENWEKIDRPSGATPGLRGVAISPECGPVTETTTTPQDIGVTATLDTIGRPVFVGLTCDASEGFFRGSPDTSTTDFYPFNVTIQLLRNGTIIYEAHFAITATNSITGGAAYPFDIPPSAIWTIDTPPAGTNAYTCRFAPSSSSGASEANCDDVKIVAFEI